MRARAVELSSSAVAGSGEGGEASMRRPYTSAPPRSPSAHCRRRSLRAKQLHPVAVGIIGDIARPLGSAAAPYANQLMTILLENLQSEVLNGNVKINILSGFGDIAIAVGLDSNHENNDWLESTVGPVFEHYLDTTMSMLRQAGALQRNPLDYDLTHYVGQLLEGILEAYTERINGFQYTDKVVALIPFGG
ncbi:hypothetical protein B0H11DRAFT_2232545 [Mycena galericulata]|nr:hypothetical protein B0H11DRAFT_2232545 [Mycena galericulata]